MRTPLAAQSERSTRGECKHSAHVHDQPGTAAIWHVHLLGLGRKLVDARTLLVRIGEATGALEAERRSGATVAIHERDVRVGFDGVDRVTLGVPQPGAHLGWAVDSHAAADGLD